MRGRRPHPSAITILRNNPGRRPINAHEPKHPDVEREVPTQIVANAVAAAEWTRVIGTLSAGHVTTVDRATLTAYCLKFAQWQALETEAAAHPFLVKAPSGYPIPNPALGMANKACSLMLRLAIELGITPSSRSRIVAVAQAQPAVLDDFTAFQRKRGGR